MRQINFKVLTELCLCQLIHQGLLNRSPQSPCCANCECPPGLGAPEWCQKIAPVPEWPPSTKAGGNQVWSAWLESQATNQPTGEYATWLLIKENKRDSYERHVHIDMQHIVDSHKMWGTCSYSRCCNSSLKYENCCRLTYWHRRSIVHRPRWDISPAYSATLMVDLIAPESPPGPNRNLSRSFNFRDGDFQYHNKYK